MSKSGAVCDIDKENSSSILPSGCVLRDLQTHEDPRGGLTETFRNAWVEAPNPAHWRLVRPLADTVVGAQAQRQAWRFLCLLGGETWIGLHDLRPATPPAHRSVLLQLGPAPHRLLSVAPRVAYAFYFPRGGSYLDGVSAPNDPVLRCRWNAPELAFGFPCDQPLQSDLDRDAPGYAALATACAD